MGIFYEFTSQATLAVSILGYGTQFALPTSELLPNTLQRIDHKALLHNVKDGDEYGGLVSMLIDNLALYLLLYAGAAPSGCGSNVLPLSDVYLLYLWDILRYGVIYFFGTIISLDIPSLPLNFPPIISCSYIKIGLITQKLVKPPPPK